MVNSFVFSCRSRSLQTSAGGFSTWEIEERSMAAPAEKTALLLCDVWDKHWCSGAAARLEKMLEKMICTVTAARERGATIIHAPSETLEFYKDSKARARAMATPRIDPPEEQACQAPPLPVDASDGGCDTPHAAADVGRKVWTRQHPAISIDEDNDLISDDGREVYSVLCHKGIEHLVILGIHTNMCVLDRSFGIKQMVRWGVDTMLCRDLTDAMYNPAMSPYVEHDEGTRLVIEYIERFWCSTVLSADITG